MADTPSTGRGDVHAADPERARQDPDNVARQQQVKRDRDALQEQARRTEASVPPEVRERTVGEMVDEAERQAER